MEFAKSPVGPYSVWASGIPRISGIRVILLVVALAALVSVRDVGLRSWCGVSLDELARETVRLQAASAAGSSAGSPNEGKQAEMQTDLVRWLLRNALWIGALNECLSVVVVATILYMAFGVRWKATWLASVALTASAWMIIECVRTVLTLGILAVRPPTVSDLVDGQIVMSSCAFLVGADTPPTLKALARALDVFTMSGLVLVGWGWCRIAAEPRPSPRSAIPYALALFAGGVLVRVAFAGVFGT